MLARSEAKITTATTCSVNQDVMNDVYQLRENVFADRLGWVPASVKGMEQDQFDNVHARYLVIQIGSSHVSSCRLIPTSHQTMLLSIFPQLLRGESMEMSDKIVEISRLASTRRRARGHSIMSLVYEGLRRYSHERQVSRYVFVTTVALERLMRRHGVVTRRFGDGSETWINGVQSIALHLNPSNLPCYSEDIAYVSQPV